MEPERSATAATAGPADDDTAAAARQGGRDAGWLLRRAVRWETGLAVLVVAIVIFGNATSPQFLTANNFFNLGLSTGEIAIMTLPMTLIIISGEIDLSVASILGMSSALLGFLWSEGWPMLAIFVVIALVGALAGLFNGLLVTRLSSWAPTRSPISPRRTPTSGSMPSRIPTSRTRWGSSSCSR